MRCRALAAGLVVAVPLAVSGFTQPASTGRQAYETRCVGCHGLDGMGGGHGPAIVDVRPARAASAKALRDLIRNGIPDAGMPAFQLSDAELDAIAGYVESLRAPAADHPAPGDPVAGEQFFNGNGNCARCHM